MTIAGVLTYNAYNTFITTLNTENVATKTLWTTSWLKTSTPVVVWFNYAYITIFMNAIGVFGYMAQLKSGDSGFFFRTCQLTLVWPIITIPMWIVTMT